MLRKLLENRIGPINDTEFAIICEIVENDLKFNRVRFKKLTNLNYVMAIAVRSAIVFRKAKKEPLA